MIAAIKTTSPFQRTLAQPKQQRASHVVAAARDCWLPGSDFPKRTSHICYLIKKLEGFEGDRSTRICKEVAARCQV